VSLIGSLILMTTVGSAAWALAALVPWPGGPVVVQTIGDCVVFLAGLTLVAAGLLACGVGTRVLGP
jgi:hypothetical protein